jgi:hypothetical protein
MRVGEGIGYRQLSPKFPAAASQPSESGHKGMFGESYPSRWHDPRLYVVSSGQGSPCLDLRRVSSESADAAVGADLGGWLLLTVPACLCNVPPATAASSPAAYPTPQTYFNLFLQPLQLS